ncbi:MAG: Crp/Fnr family transcriptional regulator [Methylobacterium mesophilicum]|nr:Crp/Fnr family transcriptional regulator [Methylobacterium mesophilicum]
MPNALIRKLEGFLPLDDADRQVLLGLSGKVDSLDTHQPIISEGDAPRDVHVILEGFAARSKSLPDGSRQIVGYLLPGDFCDLHAAILDAMDHDIVTITRCETARISRAKIKEIAETHPRLSEAFWWCTLVDEAILREWLVNIGQRSADERIAHLFCEFHTRLMAVGLASEGSFNLPITQDELGATTGLSTVQVNRSLRTLREKDLVTFRGKRIVMPDVYRLHAYSGYNPNYLHLRHGPAASRQSPKQNDVSDARV